MSNNTNKENDAFCKNHYMANCILYILTTQIPMLVLHLLLISSVFCFREAARKEDTCRAIQDTNDEQLQIRHQQLIETRERVQTRLAQINEEFMRLLTEEYGIEGSGDGDPALQQDGNQ